MPVSKKIEDVLLFQIEQASKASKVYTQREFDNLQLGITIEQWILLRIISESPNLSQKVLAEMTYRDPASITRSINILTNKGFVARQFTKENKKTYKIDLTEKGKHFVEEHLPMVISHRKRSIEGFSENELQLFSDFLRRIKENMTA